MAKTQLVFLCLPIVAVLDLPQSSIDLAVVIIPEFKRDVVVAIDTHDRVVFAVHKVNVVVWLQITLCGELVALT